MRCCAHAAACHGHAQLGGYMQITPHNNRIYCCLSAAVNCSDSGSASSAAHHTTQLLLLLTAAGLPMPRTVQPAAAGARGAALTLAPAGCQHGGQTKRTEAAAAGADRLP